MAPEAVRICKTWMDVRNADKVRDTWDLMCAKTPVISQAALWWAPEKIYGIADLVVHSSWLLERFPNCIDSITAAQTAEALGWTESEGHYIVIDIKFTTNLESSGKASDLASSGNQVRLYSYMLGTLQGLMPDNAYLIQRHPVDEPLAVAIGSILGTPLDSDLAENRDWHTDVKMNGASWEPWNIPEMQPNMSNEGDAPWHSAKKKISEEYVSGCELTSIHNVGPGMKLHLVAKGYGSRDDLLARKVSATELQSIPGIGAAKAGWISTILEANSLGTAIPSQPASIPAPATHELFVDFEHFSNLNADFDEQWPTLEGCPMIFMVGVGWADEDGSWQFKSFVSQEETIDAEEDMLESLIGFLRSHTGGDIEEGSDVRLYHWTSAEVSSLRNAADRHNRASDDLWRTLPWYDLYKEVFLKEPIGIPGAWNYKLKTIAKALNEFDPAFDLEWPGDLADGLGAMVMGWQAYKHPDPINSNEMQAVIEYNEVDCKAIWKILNWLRSLV